MIDSLQDGSTIEASSGKFKSPSGSVLKAKPEIGWAKYACSRHNYTPSAPDALLPSDAMYPRSNYANRYVTLPLIKTRILHYS